MLDPRELRIGNLVLERACDQAGNTVINRIIKINANILLCLEASHLSNLKGIDLDETWLERCGFKKKLYHLRTPKMNLRTMSKGGIGAILFLAFIVMKWGERYMALWRLIQYINYKTYGMQ
jgi:hypothetical protein